MARNTRARRLARKARGPKIAPLPEPTGSWGAASGSLTAEERARLLSRFSSLQGRSVEIGFEPLLSAGWVKAQTPEELEAATAASVGRRSGGSLN